MAQVTRENIRSQFRGTLLFVNTPEQPEVFFGRFIRTNLVRNDNQDFLYVTVEVTDAATLEVGKQVVFDIDRAIVFNDDKEQG